MSAEKYMERARELLARTRSPFDETDCFSDTLWPKEIDALADAIAALCAEIEAETVERCAKVAEPKGRRPCDCSRCDCGNRDDAEDVARWDAAAASAAAIQACKP